MFSLSTTSLAVTLGPGTRPTPARTLANGVASLLAGFTFNSSPVLGGSTITEVDVESRLLPTFKGIKNPI